MFILSPQERNKIYLSAIEAFGEDMQLTVVVEELAELAKEICKRQRGIGDLDSISEEMADVYIMIEQMALMLDNWGGIRRHIQAKTKRLYWRILQHCEENGIPTPEYLKEIKNVGDMSGKT